jgi:Tol biopolymer transport system component
VYSGLILPVFWLSVNPNCRDEAQYFVVWVKNGTSIAFGTTKGGNFEIYVMRYRGQKFDASQERITNNGVSYRYPSWSPNDQSIAFVSDRDGKEEISVMEANGDAPKRISNRRPNSRPDWFNLSCPVSPAGRQETTWGRIKQFLCR